MLIRRRASSSSCFQPRPRFYVGTWERLLHPFELGLYRYGKAEWFDKIDPGCGAQEPRLGNGWFLHGDVSLLQWFSLPGLGHGLRCSSSTKDSDFKGTPATTQSSCFLQCWYVPQSYHSMENTAAALTLLSIVLLIPTIRTRVFPSHLLVLCYTLYRVMMYFPHQNLESHRWFLACYIPQ